MSNAPRLAVVVPTYQRESTVERAVRSVLAQDGVAFEVIVVDDGSTDDTAARLAALTDPRLRVLHQANAGRGAARNAGARAATAPMLTFLDSDDEGLPGWLAEIDRLADPRRTPVVRLGLLIDRPGAAPEHRPAGAIDPDRPFRQGTAVVGSWAVARWLFDEVGGFDPALPFAENTDLFVRLALAAGRDGWREARSEAIGVRVHAEEARHRSGRYRSAQREAAEVLVGRYPRLLRHDRRTRGDYRAIIGTDELRRGSRLAGARWLARAWADHPGSLTAAARLGSAALPRRLRTRPHP